MAPSSAGPDGLQDWRRASAAPSGNKPSSRGPDAQRDARAAEEQTALPPDLPLEAPPGRIIIHLDLDAFYVGASRLRDADLVGKPVGIKQKGLLATVSYEARALGCAKLGRVTESIEKCPALILVDGEDLSFFRETSRKVFGLVSTTLGPATPVEKLGMDELWMDVTALIDGHLNAWPAADADGQRWFSLPGKHAAPKGDAASSAGFRYSATAPTGHVDSALPSLRFIIASHLAAHLRELLQFQMSLSASAGIAPNKALAKLAGAAHKPAQQTLFAPSNPRDYAAYVAKRRLRSLGGFGSSIVERITDALAASRGSVSSGEQHPADASSLTTAEVRERIDQQAFIHAFGSAGLRLWAALWGQDSTPVVHAPEFPSTISIEDTYAPTGAPASALSSLTAALMRRLDVELRGKESKAPRFKRTDRPAWGEGGGPLVRCYEQVDDGEVGPWMRWPAGLRLSTMSGGWGSRVSRQTAMPVELFDESLTREARHAALLRTLEGLQRLMCKPGGERVRLLNIAAFDLRTVPPERGIGSWLAAAEARTAQRQSIDMEFLLSLPADIRAEVAAQHGIDLDDARSTQQVACLVCGALTPPYLLHDHAIWPATGAPDVEAEGASDHDDAEQDDLAHCPLPSCGIPLPARLAYEHRLWHEARDSIAA